MKNKRIWITVTMLVVLGLLLGAFGCAKPAVTPAPKPTPKATPTPTPAPTPITLRFTTGWIPDIHIVQTSVWWMDEVEKRSGGRVKFEKHFAGEVVKLGDELESTNKGIVELATATAAYRPDFTPLAVITEMPFITEKPGAFALAIGDMHDTYAPLREEWEGKWGVKVLFTGPAFACILAAKKPIRTLEDLKGLKIRGVGQIGEALGMLGAVPVSIAFGEVYTALDTGVLDAMSGTDFSSGISMRFYEPAKYWIDYGTGVYTSMKLIINLKTWEGLPADIRQIMQAVTPGATDKYFQMYADISTRGSKILHDGGANVYILPSSEKELWRNKVVPALWDKRVADLEKKGIPAKATLDEFLKKVRAYEPQDKIKTGFEIYQALYGK